MPESTKPRPESNTGPTTVVNMRGNRAILAEPDVVRIDRGTPWGNPYRIGSGTVMACQMITHTGPLVLGTKKVT